MSGAQYLEMLLPASQGRIGAIIIDCTDFALDENSLAAELFTPSFYKNLHDLLGPKGSFS